MNDLIDYDNETPSTIECRKRKQIKYSKRKRDHGCEYDDAPELDAIVSKSDKNTSDSHRSADSGCCFLLFLASSSVRKTRSKNGSKSTERETNLVIHFSHSMFERREKTIFVTLECNIWSEIHPDFTFKRSERNIYFLFSSKEMELNWTRNLLETFLDLTRISDSFSIECQENIASLYTRATGKRIRQRIEDNARLTGKHSRKLCFTNCFKNRNELSSRSYLREERSRCELTNMDCEWFSTMIKKNSEETSCEEEIHRHTSQEYANLFPPR